VVLCSTCFLLSATTVRSSLSLHDALPIFLAISSSLERMKPPRGPRSVLWLVDVVTSACGTGLGCAPPATRPAMWAMSTMKYAPRSEEHTSELQSRFDLVCRLLLEEKKKGR